LTYIASLERFFCEKLQRIVRCDSSPLSRSHSASRLTPSKLSGCSASLSCSRSASPSRQQLNSSHARSQSTTG